MIVTLARHAMATRFEFVLCGDGESFLRSVGEAALDEIDRIETQLSFFRKDSEVSELNCHAAQRPIRVDPRLFRLLQRARALSEATDGAFDLTVGPLLMLWGLRGVPRTTVPSDDELAAARELVGFRNLELDEDNFTVRFLRDGVTLDLGGIGKGYAIERAADLVRENGIASALLHGGTSSVCAIGAPPNAEAWKIAIQNPLAVSPHHPFGFAQGRPVTPSTPLRASPSFPQPLAIVHLSGSSLSVSAQHGRGVVIDGQTYGHTIDPRTGRPVEGALLAAVVCESATDADALSTALLTLGKARPRELPVTSSLAVFAAEGGGTELEVRGSAFSVSV